MARPRRNGYDGETMQQEGRIRLATNALAVALSRAHPERAHASHTAPFLAYAHAVLDEVARQYRVLRVVLTDPEERDRYRRVRAIAGFIMFDHPGATLQAIRVLLQEPSVQDTQDLIRGLQKVLEPGTKKHEPELRAHIDALHRAIVGALHS